ncbi:hypothetical protein QR680_014110 [Steinernema hermaphroditum]|uniref:GAF domain-containing protein n=1 Tax=Steinernema hermaphroditum TaxID=289476 RepID=A0AA39I7S4_9BILA|nr:hypothetical protein QR680_014110 [Steinernema hermaphroditum]
MFLVESAVRRNSTPALPTLMMSPPSSSSSSPSPSPPVDYSFYRRGSPPMSAASALDRQTILFGAVAGHRVHFNEHVDYPQAKVISAKSCLALKDLAGTADSEGSESSSCCSDGPPDCKTKEACKRFKTLSEDMNLLVRNITKEAKALVQAEICSLFLLDKEHSELVAEVFEKNGTSDEYLTEIRMPLSQGIVGQVATTGQMMNVKDVYNHPFFYAKVDERTGFVTRNILCFPIKDSTAHSSTSGSSARPSRRVPSSSPPARAPERPLPVLLHLQAHVIAGHHIVSIVDDGLAPLSHRGAFPIAISAPCGRRRHRVAFWRERGNPSEGLSRRTDDDAGGAKLWARFLASPLAGED